ncbi:YceI family protein [Luteimonas sp. A478]
MLPTLLAFALCTLLGAAGNAAGQVRTYALDPVHTRVMVAVDHAGFSRALATVSGSTGTLRFDPDDWESARLEARVPLQRLDLGNADWNRAALASGLLDAGTHPEAVFTSRSVEPLSDTRARIHGELTLRGVTRPVTLEATLNALKRHPMPPFRRTAGFSAVGMLSRADFGISAWPGVIGDLVELRIEVEAVHAPDATFTEEEALP